MMSGNDNHNRTAEDTEWNILEWRESIITANSVLPISFSGM